MSKKISLEIVSPERPVSKDEVDFVVLPGLAGELGVLPGHTHLLAQLVAGELRYTKEGEVQIFSLSGGFAEIHPDRVEVFAETAEAAKEIDLERARMAADRAKKEMTKVVNPEDMARAQAALTRALIRLRVAEGMSKKRAYQK